MNISEIAAGIVQTTREYVAREVGAMGARLAAVEKTVATPPAPAEVDAAALVNLGQALERRFGKGNDNA